MKASFRAIPRSFKALVVVVGAVSLFTSGFVVGRIHNAYGATPVASADLIAGLYRGAPFTTKDVNFDMFWDVWNLVKQEYVDQPVSDKDLFYGALEGMLSGVKDPYSTFFNPVNAQDFNDELDGSFFGIGAQIGLDADGLITVIAPLPGTPADKAGLLAGDHILAIDGVDTQGMTVDEAVKRIRGAKGTPVKLMILSKGSKTPKPVDITRDEISVKSVTWKMRDDGIAVVSVTIFNEDTTKLFADAVKDIQSKKAKGLILDLRNNPGGLLDAATNLAGYWMNGKTAVMEEVRGKRDELTASGNNELVGLPTIVLVNGGSASASEILSGALQDYKMATLVGEKTFGKGSVQEYRDLPDGSAVKITVARWLTPLGRSINKLGIPPDVEVPLTVDDFHANRDPQLQKAVDLLKKD
ncbi:MAG: S41 family peptidase [Patescibacteria group bacterium]|jgi:carboxyl-terminal processing protease